MGPNHFRIILAYLQSVDAKSRRRILYHGTSPEVGRRVLSEGLVPDPKKRSWGEDPDVNYNVLPRTSFPGIYLTGNFMTAYSAATRTAGPRKEHIIVVVDIEESNLAHDEDALTGPIKFALNDFLPEGHILTEHGVLDIYDDMVKGDIDSKIRESAAKFLKSIDQPASEGRGKQDERVLLVDKALRALITRQASYALPTVTWYADKKTWDQMKTEQSERRDLKALPLPKDADKTWMAALEQLSNKLKPLHAIGLAGGKISDTSRIREPIGFSGSNKIVAVLGLSQNWEKTGGYTIKFLYGNPSDPRLNDFYKQYSQSMTSDYTVIDRSGKIVLEAEKTSPAKGILQESPHV